MLLLRLHGRLTWMLATRRRSSWCSRWPNRRSWRWLLLCRLQSLLHLHGYRLVPRQQPIGSDLCAQQVHLIAVEVLVLRGCPHRQKLGVARIFLQALLLHRINGSLECMKVFLTGALWRRRPTGWATRRHYAGLRGSIGRHSVGLVSNGGHIRTRRRHLHSHVRTF